MAKKSKRGSARHSKIAVASAHNPYQQEVIELATSLLEDAKAGKIQSLLAIAECTPGMKMGFTACLDKHKVGAQAIRYGLERLAS